MSDKSSIGLEQKANGSTPSRSWRLDLLKAFPFLKRIFKMRSFQFWVVLPNLLLFWVFLTAGIFGSPIGNRNIIIVMVWILWWFMLIAVLVPFFSRAWCTVCPLPFFGDWIQRRALIMVRAGDTVGTRNRFFGLNFRWPRALSNIWLQDFLFLGMATFSVALVTRPIVSVFVLGSLFVVAAIMALIWRLRAFCNYVCPISGFLSLYAMTSTIELRSVDIDTCIKCKSKSCIRGDTGGWACPWGVYVGKLDRNNYCGLCFECIKSCPHDNISLFLRPFSADTRIKGYDEAWKAFIMLTLAMVYSVTLLGPWGEIKDRANPSETGMWGGFALYAVAVWALCTLIVPSVFWVCVRLGKTIAGASNVAMKEAFLGYVFTLVPLGLMAWIAFSIPLLMVNWSYILNVASDPMGRGWDLIGTTNLSWRPFVPEWVNYIQAPALLVGLYFAIRRGYEIGLVIFKNQRQALRSFIPVAAFLVLVTIGFMKFFVG